MYHDVFFFLTPEIVLSSEWKLLSHISPISFYIFPVTQLFVIWRTSGPKWFISCSVRSNPLETRTIRRSLTDLGTRREKDCRKAERRRPRAPASLLVFVTVSSKGLCDMHPYWMKSFVFGNVCQIHYPSRVVNIIEIVVDIQTILPELRRVSTLNSALTILHSRLRQFVLEFYVIFLSFDLVLI